MHIQEIIDQLQKFEGVCVTNITSNINTRGHQSGEVTIACRGNNINLPQDLLECAIVIHREIQPINVLGKFDVADNAVCETTAKFTCSTKFLFLLKQAYEKEEWRKINKEANEFIEGWLASE